MMGVDSALHFSLLVSERPHCLLVHSNEVYGADRHLNPQVDKIAGKFGANVAETIKWGFIPICWNHMCPRASASRPLLSNWVDDMLNATKYLTIMTVFILVAVSKASAQGEPCRTIRHAEKEFAVCTVDLRRQQVKLFWKGPDGQPYGSFNRLLNTANGSRLAFAMNGGMYHEDLSPVGLYVENGRELKRASTAGGPGNFHLKPNGIFFVNGKQAGILETSRYLRQKPKVEFATQSGPMLVINGRIHPKISEQGTSRKIRNGVGVLDQHMAVFAISNEPVTFHEFASLFRDQLKSSNALFLDGSISSLYAPQLDRKDGFLPLGPIIGVIPRS